MSYHELSVEERSTIQVGLLHGFSQRAHCPNAEPQPLDDQS